MASKPTITTLGKELCDALGLPPKCTSIALLHRVGECPRVVATFLVTEPDQLQKIARITKRYCVEARPAP